MLQESLQAQFSMVHLFEYPTVSSLAEFLSGEMTEQQLVKPVDARAETRRDRLGQQKRLRQSRRSAANAMGAEHDGQ
jgi:hypothetical protein